MDTEGGEKAGVGSKPAVAKRKSWFSVVLLLRCLALGATVSATLVMALNKETKTIVVATIGSTPIKATVKAKFQHTPAFVFFVIANGIASLHNLVMLLVHLFGEKFDFKGFRHVMITISDMAMVALVASGAAAAASMAELGKNGNTHARWNKICDKFETFCDHGGGALIASFIGLEGGEKAEVGSKPAVAKRKSWFSVVLLLRCLALGATVSATLVMALNKETKTMVVATIGSTPIKATVKAKFQHTPAFVFFVIANGIASLHNLVMLVVHLFGEKFDFKGFRHVMITISDMAMVALVASGAAAAASMAELGKNGNTHARWNKICDKFDTFCDHGGGALIASFIGLEGGEKAEVGSKPAVTKRKSWFSVVLFLRCLALGATVSATLVMALNKETKTMVVATIGSTPIKATVKAKFQNTPAFVFFVIANGIASLHNLLMLVVHLFGEKFDFKGFRHVMITISDMAMVALVASGAAAAASMAELGKNGNTHAKWNKICDKFDTFCDHGGGALIASFIGLGLLMALTVLSIITLHKKSTNQSCLAL
ncbi:hypothetical protein HHK36_004830 [Tetracentron sinense]|uniref:Casparian strip membrane protein domain-containing protein n=1 Tax=Tetracentron sinense TaxID=13715 RepID=A0A834ZKK4_TETSI|nr:hypothetical protein HHK36_004830 [Tetracentron sinense]